MLSPAGRCTDGHTTVTLRRTPCSTIFGRKSPHFRAVLCPKPITPHDPDVFHPAATCRSRISESIDLGLVDEYEMVTGLTHKPVKITMTGPHMLARVAYDDFYNDLPKMMMDLAKLLRHNFRLLAATGCKNIQIDEPLFTMFDDEEVAAAVDAINSAIEGLPHDIHVSVHICQGNYAVGKEYDAQIGHRYFDTGRYKADLVCKIECSSYLVDTTWLLAMRASGDPTGRRRGRRRDPKIETGEVVADRIKECGWLVPEQTIVTASCGFNTLRAARHLVSYAR